MDGLYRDLLQIEKSSSDWREGMAKAEKAVVQILQQAGVSYDEFIFSLED
jgi:hypothetical protein